MDYQPFLTFSFSNSTFNFSNQMTSIPHEPNIVDQEQKEVYKNLQRVVGDACEEWLTKKGPTNTKFLEKLSAKGLLNLKNQKISIG